MKIFCYRDKLARAEYEYWGITLYFIEGKPAEKRSDVSRIFSIIKAITGHIKADKGFDTGRAIERLILKDSPIIEFVQMCIRAGTGKTRCYFDARKAGIAVRKQTQLALYEYLKLQEEICKVMPEEIPPPLAFFEEVRDFFVDELKNEAYFADFEYVAHRLEERSETEVVPSEDLQPGDFVWEIGELDSAYIRYYGHYHDGEFIRYKMWKKLPFFDTRGLKKLLEAR